MTTWHRDEPDSPCKSVCLVDPISRLCIGCNRTIDEISRWASMSSDERAEIRAELPGREGQPRPRQGGRAGRRARRDDATGD